MLHLTGVTSKENFVNAVDNIFNEVLPSITNPEFYDFTLKVSDIDFHERDYKGDVKRFHIKNSKDNRRPSIKPEAKKLPKKLEYAIRILCKVSSFNFLPVGVSPDSPCLEAEDRGHVATILWCHSVTQFDVKVWKKVRNIMDTYMQHTTTPHIKQVYNRLNEMIQKHKDSGFSLEELVPQEIIDAWKNQTVSVQVKVYPNRDMHIQEIIKFNGTEDTWITHQRALRNIASYLRKVNVDAENLFDSIFSYIESDDSRHKYFSGGDDVWFTSHRSQTERAENAEEEIVWLWLSAINFKTKTNSWDIYRLFETTKENKRHEQYLELVKVSAYRSVKKWKDAIDFIHAIAESKAYVSFENTLDRLYKEHAKTNFAHLSVKKVDAALMFCWVIRNYIRSNNMNDTFINYDKVAKLVFEHADAMLQDDGIVNDIRDASTGHKGRYESFFEILIARLEPNDETTVKDIKEELLLDARRKLQKTSLNPDVSFKVIDRTGKGVGSFKIVEINLRNGQGLDKGHKDPTGSGNDIDNFFLQFSGDNRSASNHQIFNPEEYADEYLAEVYQWSTTSPDHMEAYLNTKKFIDTVWK